MPVSGIRINGDTSRRLDLLEWDATAAYRRCLLAELAQTLDGIPC